MRAVAREHDNAVRELLDEEIEAARAYAVRFTNSVRVSAVLAGIFGFVILLIVTRSVAMGVARPLEAVSRQATRLTPGGTPEEGGDEVVVIADALERIA